MTQRLKHISLILACTTLAVFLTVMPAHAEPAGDDVSAAASSETEVAPAVSEDVAIVPADAVTQGAVAVPMEAASESHQLAAEETKELQEDIGFPQLKPDTYASQVFWLFISFIALYMLMAKVALPRITEVIEMRASQRNGNLSRAEQLQEEAEKVRTAYEASLAKAQEAAQSAVSEAEETVNDKMSAENAKFSDHARKRVLTAEQNIAKAKADALTSLADISADIAADIVHKITDVQISKADAKKIALAEMQKG